MIPDQQREAEPVLTPVDFLEAVAFGLIVVAAGLLATILLGTLLVLAFNATPSLTWLLGVLSFGALVLGAFKVPVPAKERRDDASHPFQGPRPVTTPPVSKGQ